MSQQGYASRLYKKIREFAIATVTTQNMSRGLPSRTPQKALSPGVPEYCMTIGSVVMGFRQ
jgi:hypothetical protein